MASAVTWMLKHLPGSPDLALRLALPLAGAERRQLLRSLIAADTREAKVVVATPRRFFRADKIARRDGAIGQMLEFMAAVRLACRAEGIGCRLAYTEKLTPDAGVRLVLSHHTFRDRLFETIEAAGSRVVHFKAGDLPGRMCLDPKGFAGWSTLADMTVEDLPAATLSQDIMRAEFEASRAAILGQNLSKYGQNDGGGPDLPARYVFVALQTINDLVQRNAYLPMLEMAEMVAARFAGSGIAVVIKRHPRCRSGEVAAMVQRLTSAHSDVVESKASIHRLMAGAEALFTVNSGVGSEAMIHRLPVYGFGKADYAATAHQIRSRAELEAATSPIRHRLDEEALIRFYHHYRTVYQWGMGDGLVERLRGLIRGAVQGARIADSAG